MITEMSAKVLFDRVAVVCTNEPDVRVAELMPDDADLLSVQLQRAARQARAAAGLMAPT